VHLFKTLVRPRMEYADAVWGAMCSASALDRLESVQEQFGRRILHVRRSTAGAYVRAELGLESMSERVTVAMLRFFGRLATMPESRLAAFVFQQRCAQVDSHRGSLSWCKYAKQQLEKLGHANVWAARALPVEPEEPEQEQSAESQLACWRSRVRREVHEQCERESQEAMQHLSSLTLFRRLGPVKLKSWLDFAVKHPGASLRLKLRCGAAPLMESVGAMLKVPREQRTCRLCNSGAVETAQHFTSNCVVFAAERAECLSRVALLVGSRCSADLRKAIAGADVELFLGDRLLRALPQQVALDVNATVCNFLKVAWRKREPLWQNFCQEGTSWRLK